MKPFAVLGLLGAGVLALSAGSAVSQPSAGCKVSLPGGAAPDVEAGRRVFLRCKSCHTLAKGEKNLVGPNLGGMFDRKPGTAAGFGYSPAFASNAPAAWTDQSLSAFVEKTSKAVPGTKMIFAGLAKPQDRADLIAYLRSATGSAACEK